MRFAIESTASGFLRNVVALLSVLTLAQSSVSSTPGLAEISPMSQKNPDSTSGPIAQQTPKPRVRAKMEATSLSLKDKPVRCTLEPISKRPPPAAATEQERSPTVPEMVKALAPDRKLLLVVKDLRTNVQPGVIYNLFLDLPDGASSQVADEHFAGSLNFFNAIVAEKPEKAAKSERFVSFDITDLARKLVADGKLKEKPVLTVVPDGKPVSRSKPLIGEVTLVEQ